MDNNNENQDFKSRRWFLSLFAPADKKAVKDGKVKMLTADGKLVEVDQAVLDKVAKQKASNKEIYEWMENPSKENSI